MKELSLGISPCPNDIFIFSGIILNEVELPDIRFRIEYLDIETLNLKAQQQEFDLVKISYANYLRCSEYYQLLSAGGALGRGVGPLLLSHGGIWRKDREVLAPGLYTTANFLLDFWADGKLSKRFITFDALYDELCRNPEAQGVVIHEKRFTYLQDKLTLIQDLGAHWEEKTGYPIPLGGLLLRKGLDEAAFSKLIQDSLTWAYANRARALALCEKHAADLTRAVIESHIDLYVNEFSFDLGSTGKAAVQFFFQQQSAAMSR
jgi:1,4-dihydroxy-6-naphthoate synthase